MKTEVQAKGRASLKYLLAAFCAITLVWSVLKAFTIEIITTVPFILISLAGLLIARRWNTFTAFVSQIRQTTAGRILTSAAAFLTLTCVLHFSAVLGLMARATSTKPAANATLIVLGCQVRGETPSQTLRERMDAALVYLRDNPDAACVLSGGQGSGERISEAECMRRYLVANGVSESRLYLEDRSKSTYENIVFSRIIIDKNGLNPTLAIATDGYHQYRAQWFAKHAGMVPGAVTSHTHFSLLPFYWGREAVAVSVQVFAQQVLASI